MHASASSYNHERFCFRMNKGEERQSRREAAHSDTPYWNKPKSLLESQMATLSVSECAASECALCSDIGQVIHIICADKEIVVARKQVQSLRILEDQGSPLVQAPPFLHHPIVRPLSLHVRR